jgi:ribose transport system substrate-binding protein
MSRRDEIQLSVTSPEQAVPPGLRGPSRYHVEVLGKALDILDVLKDSHAELRLTQIAERARLDVSTAFRILYTFEQRGYVFRDRNNKRYKLSLGFRTYRIGYAQLSADQPFVQKVTQGLLQAAEKSRVELLVTDNQNSPEETIRNARWLISQGVDFMIEYHFHSRVGSVLANMFSRANIPCLAIDIPQPGAIYFGTDNYSAGFQGGKALAYFAAKKWGGRVDRVLMLEIPEAGHIPQSRTSGTWEGMREVLPKLSKKIVMHKNGKGTETGGYSATRRVITALGPRERMLIAASNDNSARGAIRAVKEAAREQITAIMAQGWGPGSDLEDELEKASSPLIGSVAYFPETYGVAILPIVLRTLNGQPVPPAIYNEHALITRKGVHFPSRFGVSKASAGLV